MKSERVVSLLLLLQSRSPRSARELSRSLGVSIRTIYRDVDALALAGVPVYAERGSTGGIALSDGYRRAIAQFSTDELHALFAAAADPLADLGVRGHDIALHKIHGALPELQRKAAEKARQRILLDHRKWYRPDQPVEILACLRRAVWDDRVVSIAYRDRTGASSRREIEPLGLVAKAGIWYVVARSNGELRSFRADRIADCAETQNTFSRPADFDLERYWSNTMSSLERMPEEPVQTELTLAPEAVQTIAPYFPSETLEENERAVRIRVSFPSVSTAVSHIMMVSAHVEHIAEPALRKAVAERARRILSVLEHDANGLASRALTREDDMIRNEAVGNPENDVQSRGRSALQNDAVRLDAPSVGSDAVGVGK